MDVEHPSLYQPPTHVPIVPALARQPARAEHVGLQSREPKMAIGGVYGESVMKLGATPCCCPPFINKWPRRKQGMLIPSSRLAAVASGYQRSLVWRCALLDLNWLFTLTHLGGTGRSPGMATWHVSPLLCLQRIKPAPLCTSREHFITLQRKQAPGHAQTWRQRWGCGRSQRAQTEVGAPQCCARVEVEEHLPCKLVLFVSSCLPATAPKLLHQPALAFYALLVSGVACDWLTRLTGLASDWLSWLPGLLLGPNAPWVFVYPPCRMGSLHMPSGHGRSIE